MSRKQRVLLVQLQLAGLGLVLMGFGWIKDHQPIFYIGTGVFILAMVRLILFRRFLKDAD